MIGQGFDEIDDQIESSDLEGDTTEVETTSSDSDSENDVLTR